MPSFYNGWAYQHLLKCLMLLWGFSLQWLTGPANNCWSAQCCCNAFHLRLICLFFYNGWQGLPTIIHSPWQYCQQQQLLSMCSTLLWSFPPLGDVIIYKLPNVIILTKDKKQSRAIQLWWVPTKSKFKPSPGSSKSIIWTAWLFIAAEVETNGSGYG